MTSTLEIDLAKPKFMLVDVKSDTYSAAELVAQAERHLKLPEFKGDRLIGQQRIAFLRERLAADEWTLCRWATVEVNGVCYRINGKHSATTIISNPDLLRRSSYTVEVERYTAEDGQGVALLFQQFDNRGSVRGPEDIARACAGAVPELADELVNTDAGDLINRACGGIDWRRVNVDHLQSRGDKKFEDCYDPDNIPFIAWYSKIMRSRPSSRLQKSPKQLGNANVIAAMLFSHRDNPQLADAFWLKVASPEANETDHAYHLAAELIRLKEEKLRGKPITLADVYARCVVAWQDFKDGRQPRNLRLITKSSACARGLGLERKRPKKKTAAASVSK